MAVPAILFLALTWPDAVLKKGWAIPTATDIVLALGLLSLLGDRVPDGLRVFLAALAIFDDIAAVAIIGLFYGKDFSAAPLLVSVIAAGGLVLLSRFCVTWRAAYAAVGLVLWVAMLKAGLEAALAGFIIALAVPMRVAGFRSSSPVREMEQRLHPWCILLVVPAFAFFNSGISVNTTNAASLLEPAPLGIVAGLFLGKQLGVFGSVWITVRLGLGALPERVDWAQLYGVALLTGVGFTMSLFVATLAFSGTTLGTAKLAVLVGSALSATAGLLWLAMTLRTGRGHAGATAQRRRKFRSTCLS
jgi:NhaA family Na+:H+ antiporter